MFETQRLILRQWQDSDIEPFIQLNQDQKVMEFFPRLLSTDETLQLIDKIKVTFNQNGFGLYAVELKDNHKFIGYIGLHIPDWDANFTPCVEIGWRLAHEYWGRGLAVEGAKKCLEVGFNDFNLNEIVSFTAKINYRSERVMQKLGMIRDLEGDFYHPKLDLDHPLALHILYRLSRYNFLCR